ncbi:hypothetical protein [Roseovarius sp. MMSF_3281]|uniref:hypothetical protein n=1 Tax=Roseovarius sp. MMSF_3281 TaxID=3046694 RepID=UPI00273DA73C|nr:hypothetical protein [Roseovarius sp. MMSF_3281]
MSRGLTDLAALTEAQYRAKQAELEPVLTEERRLRRALADLEDNVSGSAALPLADTMDLQRVGGDMAWRRWAAQSRSDLQTKLARVLAQKAAKMAGLKQAFGRAEAVAAMKHQEATDRTGARDKAQLEAVQDLIRLKMSL